MTGVGTGSAVGCDGSRVLGGMFVALVAMVTSGFGTPTRLSAQSGWDAARWDVRAQESRAGVHLGREGLYLVGGTAWLKDVDFLDGVIELDMAATGETGFHGVRFRAVEPTEHEHVYLRPHLSDRPDAVQYNPIFHGVSGWQIYADERYVQQVTIPVDRWVHVRVAVRGERMELSVDGQRLVFPHLVREPAVGAVGVNSSGAGVWFANVEVYPDADVAFSSDPGASAPEFDRTGVVRSWRVSEVFDESLVDGATELPSSLREGLSWESVEPEVRGIANLARLRGRSDGNTVFAAVTLRTDRARTVPLDIGFSDRVRVFLNGRQLFAAADAFASRDYRFLGTIGFFDTVFLPLEPGDNEVWLAVSETFGGWGVAARLPAGSGVDVR